MTTAANQKQAVLKSAENVFERIVEFPLWDEYGELLNSDVADLKNIGGRSRNDYCCKIFRKFY